VADDRLAGAVSGVLPDGRPIQGKVVVEKASDDAFEVYFKGTADGEEYTDVGKFERKK
jgi:hypothetical protein